MNTLLMFMKEKRTELFWAVLFASVGAILSIVPFVLIYKIIILFMENGTNIPISTISNLILIALGVIIIKYSIVISSFIFSHIAAFDLLYIIRTRITEHLGKLPMGFWNKNNSGKIRKIIQEDVERIELFVAHHLPDTVSGIILPIATAIFLFTINWKLALVTMIPLPIGMIMVKMMFSGFGNRKINRRDLWDKYLMNVEKMHSTIVEFVEGIQIIKAFNITANSFSRLTKSVSDYRDLTVGMSKTQSPYYAVFTAITIGGGLFIIPFGLYLLKTGQIDVGSLLMFLIIGSGCLHQYVKVMEITGHMEIIFAGGNRIQSVLDEKVLTEPDNPVKPDIFNIEIRNLNFKYDPQGKMILNNINADIPENSLVAIVGPSGSGKSTLVNLLARMWETPNGTIKIGGKDISDIGSENINEITGTVFQDVILLTDTVENNIRMNSKELSMDAIIQAAKIANCHDFISCLPKGYQTIIGEGGEVHLSGGEKQRISIARIALKQPKIVLLDEASSYSDSENEVKIQEAFGKMMYNRTMVVIAHRLSTIVHADKILVMNEGKIVEQGTFDSLIEQNGLFARMWKIHNRKENWKIELNNKKKVS